MIERAYLLWPEHSDPLRVVAGLPLLLRQILSLQDAGISEIFLVGAPAGLLPQDPRVTISVEEGAAPPAGPALIARADLLWHPALAKELAASSPGFSSIQGFDEGEGGLYAAGEGVLPSLLAAGAEGLGRAVGRASEAPLRPLFILRGDNPRALSLLLDSLIKPVDGVISRNINRRLSLQVTRRLLSTAVTPNQMTLFAALFGVLAIFFAMKGGFWGFFWGGLFLQAQSVLDGCDGELARLTYRRSRLGEWLDNLCDDAIDTGFLVAVGLSLARAGWAWVGTLTLAATLARLFYHATIYYALFTRAGGSGNPFLFRWWFQKEASGPYLPEGRSLAGRFARGVSDALQAASRRDFYLFFYFIAALLGHIEVAFFWQIFCALVAGTTTLLQWVIAGVPEATPPGSR